MAARKPRGFSKAEPVPGEKRGGPPKAVAGALSRVTRQALGKRGFAEGSILRDWGRIVGPELARMCVPLKLTRPRNALGGGTLELRVASSAAATLLQHRMPQLIERINGHFGYQAVARVKQTHGPLPPPPPSRGRPPRALTEAEAKDLETGLSGVRDPELRAALERLGRAVLGRN